MDSVQFKLIFCAVWWCCTSSPRYLAYTCCGGCSGSLLCRLYISYRKHNEKTEILIFYLTAVFFSTSIIWKLETKPNKISYLIEFRCFGRKPKLAILTFHPCLCNLSWPLEKQEHLTKRCHQLFWALSTLKKWRLYLI